MTWYSTGTVTVTNGSRTVTGAGTDFVSNVLAGQAFIGAGDSRSYEIEQVVSATQLLLRKPYLAATGSGQSYDIMPNQGPTQILVEGVSNLLATFGAVRDGIGAGLMKPGNAASPGLRFENDQDTGLFWSGNNSLSVATGGVERAIFDGSGRLMIGSLTAAERLNVAGKVYVIADGEAGYRIYNGGQSVEWFMGQKSISEHALTFQTWVGASKTDMLTMDVGGNVYSGKDNNLNALGLPNKRWSTVFAGTGTINTSDRREKVWRGGMSDAELAAARRIINELGFFQWSDSVAEKGEDGARMHFGVRAQEAARILIEEGVEQEQPIDFASDAYLTEDQRPSFRTGFLCFDTWQDEFAPEYEQVEVPHQVPSGLFDHNGNVVMKTVTTTEMRPTGGMIKVQSAGNRFGLRMDQLALFIAAALAADLKDAKVAHTALSMSVSALEARMVALEASR
jgi:hypothetical protein